MKTTIPTQSIEAAPPPRHIRPTFAIACWAMALIAFTQLITVGTALTVRNSQPLQKIADEPRVTIPLVSVQPRSLEDILASVGDAPPSPLYRVPASISAVRTPVISKRAVILPAIADSRVERLLQESRGFQMDGDMMRAMLKLDEASRLDPSEPAVTYRKAQLYEEMGIFVKAADLYQKVQQMGKKAGRYFNLAAIKLTEGMDTAEAMRNIVSIGPMQTRKTKGPEGVKKAEVNFTILARPDKAINPLDVDLQIHFYDKLNGGEIEKALPTAFIESSWVNPTPDWKNAANEENLNVTYSIPSADLADEYLLGRREFYGYVVELIYKGEVIDQQAQPRHLHSVHSSKMAPIPQNLDEMPWLPDDEDSILPDKSSNTDYQLPPLPTR